MLSQNSAIQEFLFPVPICCATNCLTDLRSHLSGEKVARSDRLVVVDREELPIGVLYLHSLIPYFHSQANLFSSKRSLESSRSSLEPIEAMIQPLEILPGTLCVRDFLRTLQELQQGLEQKDWGVVNSQGKLLGLLDVNRLLGFVASHCPLQGMTPDVWARERESSAIITGQPERRFEESTDRELVGRSFVWAIAAIEQVLEPLPMPVKLQDGAGQTIAENLAWRQKFGECSNTERSVLLTPGLIAESTTERNVNTTGVSHLLNDLDESNATLMCSLSNGSEQSWKFFKIPLDLDLSKMDAIDLLFPQTLFESGNIQSSSEQSPGKTLRSPPQEQRPIALGDRPFDCRTGIASSIQRESQRSAKFSGSWCLIIAEDISEQQQVAKELIAKNADLVQLKRLKDEFLACVSHELKTPLTAVLGLSTLLKNRALGPLNERQARYANMIYQSGQHLMRVVNDILDLTRIETGQLQLNWEPVQLKLVCENALKQAIDAQKSESATIGDRTVESHPHFTLEIEPGLDTILADRLRLRQMLYNLLSNALKFTSPDGAIGLTINRWQGWIAFTVWDTGIGIPGDKQHLIFQRFQQLENPLTRRFEGTGLGLVLTQGLARAHGGDVTFISKEEKGSKFTILLPPAPSELETVKEFPIRDRLLVLIVDAVPQYIEDLYDGLVQLGYRVAISRCGVDALEKARRLQPCVIFLNPLLPLLSGWDLLTLLKSDPQTRHIPAIVTATVVDKKRAIKLRADGCLSLPSSLSKLQEQLKYVVSAELPKALDCNANKLTILRLTANVDITNPMLLQGLKSQATKKYQILEADDLEQAELLVQIWHPQVLLVEEATALPDPQTFFQELSKSSRLANLPIVTVDLETTKAANKVSGLIVFPCLTDRSVSDTTDRNNDESDPDRLVENSIILNNAKSEPLPSISTAATRSDPIYLLQAIELAANLKTKPNVLAVNFSMFPEFYQPNHNRFDEPFNQEKDSQSSLSTIDRFMELVSSVQSVDLNMTIGRSWSEVWQIVQQQSVDLLLLYIPVYRWVIPLLNGLKAIAKMIDKPPVLMIYDRRNRLMAGYSMSEKFDNDDETISPQIQEELGFMLKKLATKVLPNSLSKEELLQEVEELLTDRQLNANAIANNSDI